MKQCSKCQQNKNFDQFYKSSASKDDHSRYCKDCQNEYKRKKRGSVKRYNKRGFISETHKECTQCREIKTFDEFAKNRGNASGLHSWCKDCMTNRSLEYRGGRVFKILDKTDTHKQCRSCGEMKIVLGNKNSYCDDCVSEKNYTRNIKLRFNMSLEDYNNMLSQQGGVCAICKTNPKEKRLSVDHDHRCCPEQYTCGKCTRGLLCSYCNKTLGLAKDDISVLENMINYLKSYK